MFKHYRMRHEYRSTENNIVDDNPNSATQAPPTKKPVHNPFSNQPTGLVETTFAETLGLSMHNAIFNQQSSQMTTSASITNACARLLQTPVPLALKPQEPEEEEIEEIEEEIDIQKPKKRFNIFKFLKSNKNNNDKNGDLIE